MRANVYYVNYDAHEEAWRPTECPDMRALPAAAAQAGSINIKPEAVFEIGMW
jgi:hypothetical protein